MDGMFAASASYTSASNDLASFNQARAALPLIGLSIAAIDFAAILGTPALAYQSAATGNLGRVCLFYLIAACASGLLIASHRGYTAPALATARAARNAVFGTLAVFGGMLGTAFLSGHNHSLGWQPTTASLAGIAAIIAASRFKARHHLREQAATAARASATLVICYDRSPNEIGKTLCAHGISRNIAGVCYLGERRDTEERACGPVIDGIDGLMTIVRQRPVRDIVFIYQRKFETMTSELKRQLLSEFVGCAPRIWLACDLGDELPPLLANRAGRYRMVPIVNDSLITANNVTKRAFDIVAAAAILLAASPLIAVIAMALRLSGRGPVVFRQIRTGAYGRRFAVLKFRSMRHVPQASFAQARPGDQRVTRIGRFLRRSSLDELLQLINVLKGEMSLVGPRPHAPETQVLGVSFENAVSLYRMRHRVKPGITGLAQIRGHRGETARLDHLEQRVSSDIEYIDRWSLWLDIVIMLRTIPTMFRQHNAY